MSTKLCNGCGQDLPVEKFGLLANTNGRRRARCNKCRAKEIKDKRAKEGPRVLTEKQKASAKKSAQKYAQSKKGKANQKKWAKSPKRKAAYKRWANSEKGKASRAAACKRLQSKRRAFIQKIKLEHGCVDCGYSDNPHALDFDHVRGNKSFNVSQTCGRSEKALLAEIAKCEVRCANCHRIKTYEQNQHKTKTKDSI